MYALQLIKLFIENVYLENVYSEMNNFIVNFGNIIIQTFWYVWADWA